MKTTVNIADPLFLAAKRLAALRATTLKSVMEAALRSFLEQEESRARRFRLRDASVAGDGLQDGVEEGNRSEIRRLVYEGRGG
ncbi:MAG: DUF2191 domain-containing protein [bacterium]|nr:DUF2191 domain-containing protein [bacterium]